MAYFFIDAFQLLSLAASFVIAAAAVLSAPRSIVFLAALAVVLFVLFGPLGLPGFFLGVGAAALLRGLGKPGAGKRGKNRRRHRIA